MKAFYFANDEKTLRYEDGRRIRVGATHKIEKPENIKLCKYGLHASKRLIDALKYAPGPCLYVVECGGQIVEGDDKIVCSERKYLARFNAEKVLRAFARKQALINIEKIKTYCSTENYDIVLQFLRTGDKKLRPAAESAARSAAWSAARSAAESAAWSAAWSAARLAAESAARLAAESAARSAAWSAARSAAESAVESAANDMILQMIIEVCDEKFKAALEAAGRTEK